MPSIRQIRSRIRVAKNIQQITKAMKMVAAARLKRAQDRVTAARPYAETMREVMTSLAGSAAGAVDHPLLERREVKTTGVLIITADRGLAGSYTSAILRKGVELLKGFDKDHLKLYVIGKKGHAFYRRRGFDVEILSINSNEVKFEEALNITRLVRTAFETGQIDELHLVYTKFKTAMTQFPSTVKLLPIEPPATGSATTKADTIYEPDPATLLGELLPRYLLTQIYQTMLESIASEHGSRMTSMSSATDNAGKMISTLTLSLNRARQASITKELAEIVGGAEALKG